MVNGQSDNCTASRNVITWLNSLTFWKNSALYENSNAISRVALEGLTWVLTMIIYQTLHGLSVFVLLKFYKSVGNSV